MLINIGEYENFIRTLENLAHSTKSKDLAKALAIVKDEHFPLANFQGAWGEEFRKRQLESEQNFNRYIGVLNVMVASAADDAAYKAILDSVLRWNQNKNDQSFQKNFDKEIQMENIVKTYVDELLQRTSADVAEFSKGIESYRSVTGEEPQSNHVALCTATKNKLNAIRKQLSGLTVTDNKGAVQQLNEIKKNICIIRKNLPNGYSSQPSVNAALARIEKLIAELPSTKGDTIKGLKGAEPFYTPELDENGNPTLDSVNKVDEITAGIYVYSKLSYYHIFFEENIDEMVRLLKGAEVNYKNDKVFMEALRQMKLAEDNAKRVGKNHRDYPRYVREYTEKKAIVESRKKAMDAQGGHNREIAARETQIRQFIEKFEIVCKELTLETYGTYRERYAALVEKGFHNIEGLYNELRSALRTGDQDKVDRFVAKIEGLISTLREKPTLTEVPFETQTVYIPNTDFDSDTLGDFEDPFTDGNDYNDLYDFLDDGEKPRQKNTEKPAAEEPRLPDDPNVTKVNVGEVEEVDNQLDEFLKQLKDEN